MHPIIHPVYEPTTGSWQYIVVCSTTNEAAIIDPVLDFDPSTATISTASADTLLKVVSSKGYRVRYLLETHAHADHLTASFYLQQTLLQQEPPHHPEICIGNNIRQVQETVRLAYDIPTDELSQSDFDHLFADGAQFPLGQLTVSVLALPGHTPDHIGYCIGPNVFTGDSIFNPDVGSARCDFPGGDARVLYRSMKRLLALPGEWRLYTGHDYPPTTTSSTGAGGEPPRDPVAFVTVAEQRERNKHAKLESNEEEFVRWRSERDRSLREPRLLHQALQVNVRAGRLPRRTDNGLVLLGYSVRFPEILVAGG
ncbi:Ethylmalonic encephalopathy 1 [Aspergillus nanangensis]|uniref:Ethylmalonic encephalopathy 1 n=1 Tax=Aspergillus nanangensis TaxID=2582783 RepID=A0AAD4CCL3_ASPNN|nr:Ethylmalonic encephalopathy 1 [Aspergillus nanangensis]